MRVASPCGAALALGFTFGVLIDSGWNLAQGLLVAIDPVGFSAYNANYDGGDIVAGANSPRQLIARPRLALDPYKAAEGIWICSAATPPGGGVHGMGGANAARSVLKSLGRN